MEERRKKSEKEERRERGREVDTQTYTADSAAHTWIGHARMHCTHTNTLHTHSPGGASKSH